jgi:4-amino-4-deoxy-L-arabinose transferase-like glycosyltransferase
MANLTRLEGRAAKPLVVFIIASAIAAVATPLFQRGLFIDGLLYKTVALNYARGESTFWEMFFTPVSMNPFHEQPPFFFFVTGSWFRLFGHGIIADKVLTLLLFITTMFLLWRISVKLAGKINGYVALLFMLMIPVFHWTFVNQVIESLVTPVTLACFLLLLSFRAKSRPFSWSYPILFGLGVIVLFLCKGFQSCFIIVAPFFYLLLERSGRMLWFTIISLVLSAGVLCLLLFHYPPSAAWFDGYFHKRLLSSLEGVGATTGFRFEIVIRIITELLLPIVVLAGVRLWRGRRGLRPNVRFSSDSKVLLFTALCGSVPYVITLEQRGFYLTPAFPFYVLFLTLAFREELEEICVAAGKWLAGRTQSVAVWIMLVLTVIYWMLSPFIYKRDKNLLTDLARIEKFVAEGDTVTIDPDMWNDTALQAYLYMKQRVVVDQLNENACYIHDREHGTMPRKGYRKVMNGSVQYDLYVRE